jgi:hypothetical protein
MDACLIVLPISTISDNADTIAFDCTCSIQVGQDVLANPNERCR